MANRRNFRRHRGLSENMGGSPIDPETPSADAAETLEEIAAAALEREDIAPTVRAEKVARAKALISNPDYPPKEVLQSVAGLLANHLSETEPR
jgi:hypothetical protein